ncbi:hypothetical protein C0Q70_19311 [Pomacea canaliculata]|uniref:Uncharacterized protein n=1 Tax=Pomacea canaliculata TaxID=400727 RepID=A0A2T7NJ01_POMCA|nr:hypothetical protein C0Q70_19311 [Pomacea canaliculata]
MAARTPSTFVIKARRNDCCLHRSYGGRRENARCEKSVEIVLRRRLELTNPQVSGKDLTVMRSRIYEYVSINRM